jgi:hypothetical protein
VLPGLFGAPTAHIGFSLAVILALAISYVMARGWSANCAPDWIEA